jgi:hypothetical protein
MNPNGSLLKTEGKVYMFIDSSLNESNLLQMQVPLTFYILLWLPATACKLSMVAVLVYSWHN